MDASIARTFERLLAEKDERNRDNVSRTSSYLELYLLARETGHELPWVLMAHLVSRHAGYLMTDLGSALRDPKNVFTRDATIEMFFFLERANYIIFWDAWKHALHHLLGRTAELDETTPRFVREAWARFEAGAKSGVSAALERALVLDLVVNEQNVIEGRVVRNPRFSIARAMVAFFEATGVDAPIELPLTDARIKVGRFEDIARRIETGRRIFDEVLADTRQRDRLTDWARAHPHDGRRDRPRGPRSIIAPRAALRDLWPVDEVRRLCPGVHDDPEPDPRWP